MIDPKILHRKFVQLGLAKRKLTYELLTILPEIFESGIWKKYSSSIYEYAGKFGGLSRSMVEKRLSLEKDLKDKPKLKEAIKEAGVYKVAMVAKITTPELDWAMADKVINMSKSAVQTLSKELRQESLLTENTIKNCSAEPELIKIELDKEMSFMFMKLKKKLGKDLGNKDVMRIILNKMVGEEKGFFWRTKKSAQQKPRQCKNLLGEKEILKRVQDDIAQVKDGTIMIRDDISVGTAMVRQAHHDKPVPRHIPAPKKREELAKTNGHCAYPNCNHPPENWHHRDRFSQSKNHDSAVPLCKNHHEFMHNGLVKNELSEPKNWQIDLTNKVSNDIDNLYRKYRQN
ncbi:HNH endonuclease [Candidatus Peregrinibacteria bacterium]|nr:HNH endonuclease [Candidatus Peregrinibacteria bacterium]